MKRLHILAAAFTATFLIAVSVQAQPVIYSNPGCPVHVRTNLIEHAYCAAGCCALNAQAPHIILAISVFTVPFHNSRMIRNSEEKAEHSPDAHSPGSMHTH